MKQYLAIDPWKIIEEGFHPENNRVTESIFSLGNGRFGQRGNFEEHYSGDSLQGNYFAGVYYPDKTRVGWWKNGYPEYFAKVLNGVDWAGMDIYLNDTRLDLNALKPKEFVRTLDMQRGLLQREFLIETSTGKIRFSFERFCSMADNETGAVRVKINSLSFSGRIRIDAYLDWQVTNEDANWDESFWIHRNSSSTDRHCRAMAETRKTGYVVSSAMTWNLSGKEVLKVESEAKEKYCSIAIEFDMSPGEECTYDKYTGHQSTMYHKADAVFDGSLDVARRANDSGYPALKKAHVDSWSHKWKDADILIEGDDSAQQGIRFNIFHLLQTYTGEDARLNIGPKGFTGEKYGGSTYWDTEAYCIPFYLGSGDLTIARQLLVYRYQHLAKAIENAEKLGFSNGAALYPMVTMNGEECHNEWEITFEEIHRNGAIAYAIAYYINYTGDSDYLLHGGLEVLIGIARFWSQRVNWSTPKQQYVMLGVTGPNEYENNVDNNWYTNYIAAWCLNYAADSIDETRNNNGQIIKKTQLKDAELKQWREIAANMYLPEDESLGIFLQQDNYLEKEQLTADQITAGQRPINQNWSWDRILRSCFIKQADVLQGMFFFESDFDLDALRRNFEFYEPRTVHESSLSPCVHSILASQLDMGEKAYEMYLRTARLDLDDFNNDTDDGLHITSMAGTWMSVIKGFGGVRVKDGSLSLSPSLPRQWHLLKFNLRFRENIFSVEITSDAVRLTNVCGPSINVIVHQIKQSIHSGSEVVISMQGQSIST
ncbi:MAG: glycoside hydrolase family 65 protein [Bacteroidetes bacterium]|nr:MAG: glycoside hydrolase family 65 protein [Bacteroidota bacterium]